MMELALPSTIAGITLCKRLSVAEIVSNEQGRGFLTRCRDFRRRQAQRFRNKISKKNSTIDRQYQIHRRKHLELVKYVEDIALHIESYINSISSKYCSVLSSFYLHRDLKSAKT